MFLDLAHGDKKTTQMVYVLAQVKHLLLSQTVCKEPGLGAKDFPNAAAQPGVAKCTATEDDKDDGRGCNCPTRVEAVDPLAYHRNASQEELEAINRKHYASLAFNTCERQKLPVMQGQQCELFVDPKARTFAIHKHKPVAIHWEKETRQGARQRYVHGRHLAKDFGRAHSMVCAYACRRQEDRKADESHQLPEAEQTRPA